jgi:RND family efflux transporter MFP subunit
MDRENDLVQGRMAGRGGRGVAVRVAGLTLAALLAASPGCRRPVPPIVEPEPPQVTVARPVARAVTEYVEFTGNAIAVDTVDVKARVSGFITAVHFADGQAVARGDALFDIDDRPYAIARDQAAADVAKAQAELDELEREVVRNRPLVPRAVVTEEQFQILVAKRDVAAAGRDKAQASLAQANLDLGFCKVGAPIDGRIGSRRVTTGDLVSGASGSATSLATVVSVDPIRVTFNADERSLLVARQRAADHREGRPAGAAPAAGVSEPKDTRELAIPVDAALVTDTGFPRHGVLDFIDIAVKATTGTVRCRAEFPNPEGLITPGMFLRVRLPIGPPTPALLVADRAIGTDQGRKYVAVVGADGRVEHRPITPGPLDGGLRVVTSGLAADERVVTAGLLRARPGGIVRPIEAAME